MKKFLLPILTFMLIACFGCNDANRNRLRLQIEKMNSEFPVSLGNVGVCEGIRYETDDNTVVFSYGINEDISPIASLSKAGEEQKAFLANFLRSNEFGTNLLEELVKADASMRLVYRGLSSGDSTSVTLDADELREIAATEISGDTNMMQLESMLAITNRQCPQDVGEGLTLTAVNLADGFMVFYYEYNPEEADYSVVDRELLKEAYTESLREDLQDVAGRSQLKLMKSCGVGVKYALKASDGSRETIIVEVSPETVASF